jgi:hypothetical protein
MGRKTGQKSEGGGRPFDRLRAGHFDRLRFFYNDFAPLALGWEFDGVPHKYMRLSEWRRAGERRFV